MDNDLRVFRELVLWLWQTHEKPWEYSHKGALYISQDLLRLNQTLRSFEELETLLPSEEVVCGGFGGRYLYLNPVIEGRLMVPRIQINYDFGRNIPEIRCRLEMFLIDKDDESPLKSLGCRFESPEGQNDQGKGIHHYYHIQIIQPPTSNITWLPVNQPAFPLNADNPVKLLLCVLVSLYGLGYMDEVIGNANHIHGLKKYFDEDFHNKFGPFLLYRQVEIGDPVKHKESYQVESSTTEFEEWVKNKYTGCTVKGITKSAFDSTPSRNRKNFPN